MTRFLTSVKKSGQFLIYGHNYGHKNTLLRMQKGGFGGA